MKADKNPFGMMKADKNLFGMMTVTLQSRQEPFRYDDYFTKQKS